MIKLHANSRENNKALRPRLESVSVFIVTLIIIAIVAHWQWFIPGHQFRWEDSSGIPNVAFSNMGYSYNGWISITDVGYVNVQLYQLMFFQLWHLLATLGANYALTFQITMLWPIAVLSFVSPFLLIRQVLGSNRAGFVGALVYGSSGSFLLMQGFEVFIALAFSLLPLVLFAAERFLRKHDWQSVILFVLLFSLMMYIEIRVAFLTALLTLLLALVIIISDRHRSPDFKKLVVAASLLVALNLFWLVGVFGPSTGAVSALTGRGVFGNQYTNFPHALTLLPGSWVNGTLVPFVLGPVPVWLWVLPIGALVGMCVLDSEGSLSRRQTVIFASLVAWSGVLLATQANLPVPFLYPWLYTHIPGFSLFRVGTDFAVVAGLGYGLLIGGIFAGVRSTSASGMSRVFRRVYGLGLAATVVVMLVPLIDGQAGSLFVHRDSPAGFQQVESLIDRNNSFFRTLWLPSLPTWSVYSMSHPAIGAADLLSSGAPLSFNTPYGESLGSGVLGEIGSLRGQMVLEQYLVRYIILPPPDSSNSGVLYANYGEPRSFYQSWLSHQRWLVRVRGFRGGYSIFRFTKPRVDSLVRQGNRGITGQSDVINSSLIVGLITSPVATRTLFNVSMAYNPDWRAFVVPRSDLSGLCKVSGPRFRSCDIGSGLGVVDKASVSKYQLGQPRRGAGSVLQFELTSGAAKRINALEKTGGAALVLVFGNYSLEWKLLLIAEILIIGIVTVEFLLLVTPRYRRFKNRL